MTVTLRAATLDDCERVWPWNFAADVRAMSNDPTIVELASTPPGTCAASPSGAIWIIEDDGVPVGVVRID